MKARILMIGAAALAFAPALASAAPGGNGSTNGTGFDHMNGPTVTTGQPGADCELLVESGQGSTPGSSASAPGSAFNPDGNAGTRYAGEQSQNSRNTSSVAQYDVACARPM